MYIPKHFRIDDSEKIYDFIESNSFGIIFSNHNQRPEASHLPFIVERGEGYLYGHFARPNTQWKDIGQQEVLIVFSGPHIYISSSLYETNLSVPTWNYVAVHVYGRVEIIEDLQEGIKSLEKLVTKYEGSTSPYSINETNRQFVEGLSKGIVMFKMKIERMEGKWKLSQNHSKERQFNVIKYLEQSTSEDAQQIADLMKQNNQ
ncbi:FMN-binding negative transcriptional regulator [Paenibacillus sp. L3-i20]|uniref:FMN-binding negative transcriptional regulator n=1 Tax=Paenibacillus sp. L3-i20 TaxID=2905833 RepID=UPI001EE03F67|nr:FMN-binding negative transcriptional regulator [Paenibacillus sp. L3-i20]GKU79180.1 protease synthase and sporulation protein PAI 2 [Paenibacillus sp. L3-i20]